MELKTLQRLRNALLLLGLCVSGGMVQGQVYTFTTAGATGSVGPTQAQVTTAYASTTLATGVTVTGGIQSWTVPAGGAYKIEVYGANGYGVYGGKGAYMSGEFNLNANDVLKILVGQAGQCCNSLGTNQYGGGGGSFVVAATGNTPLIIAGGGGGAATCYPSSATNLATSHNTAADASITTTAKDAVGSTAGLGGTGGNGGGAGSLAGGGGGFSTDGLPAASGGFAFVNGGAGGAGPTAYGTGGFGGGGGATSYNNMRGGGGGGYSGGGGAGASTSVVQIGGGGGSYNSGTNQVNTPALGTGQGSVIITKLGPPCNAPTGLAASGITAGGANLSWTAVTGAIGYEYAVTTSATPPASGTQQPGTTYSASGLSQGTNYYLHVRTNCSSTNSSGWSTLPFTTLTCTAPGAPTSSSVTSNSAIFSWGAVSSVVGYEYALTGNSTPPTGSGTATTATTYTAIGLNSSTNYCLHVRTQCSPGVYSGWVNTCITTLTPPPCAGPDTLNVTNITSSSADLSWNSVAGQTEYEYAVTTTATPPASGSFVTGTSKNVTGLMSNTQYYAHVRDTCSGGLKSAWKTAPFNTPYPPCDPPVASVSNITNEAADVSWNVMPEAISYQVAVFSNSNPPTVSGIPTTGTTYHANNLVSGKLYYVHVRSICSFDTSSWATSTFYTAVPQSVTSVGSSTAINVHPNPVNDVLYVNLTEIPGKDAVLVLTDITSKTVRSLKVTSKQSELNLKDTLPGVYLLKYMDENTQQVMKIVKQ